VSVHSFAKEIQLNRQLNDTGDVGERSSALVNRDEVSLDCHSNNIINGMRISPGPAAPHRAPGTGHISYYTWTPHPVHDIYQAPIKANAHDGSKPRAVKPYCYMPLEGTLVQNAAVGDQRLAWHILATLHPPTLSTRSG
jgi:hypothetical protein